MLHIGIPGNVAWCNVGQHEARMGLGIPGAQCHLAACSGTNRCHLAADVGTDRYTFIWVKIYASEYIISLLLKKSFIKYKSFYLYFNLNYLCVVIFTSSSALRLDAASWVG